MKKISLIGKTFGRLKVISECNIKTKCNHIQYNCICECGNNCLVRAYSLRTNNTTSCGCYRKDKLSDLKKGTNPYLNTPEYMAWENMKRRCNSDSSPGYKNYKGRGIKVCDVWSNSFECFLKDVGERPSNKHSLDRINNDGHYEPTNIRWATRQQQNLNTRQNVIFKERGIEITLNELIEKTDLTRSKYKNYRYGKKLTLTEIFNKFYHE